MLIIHQHLVYFWQHSLLFLAADIDCQTDSTYKQTCRYYSTYCLKIWNCTKLYCLWLWKENVMDYTFCCKHTVQFVHNHSTILLPTLVHKLHFFVNIKVSAQGLLRIYWVNYNTMQTAWQLDFISRTSTDKYLPRILIFFTVH